MKLITFNIIMVIVIVGTVVVMWNEIGWLRFIDLWWGFMVILIMNVAPKIGIKHSNKKVNSKEKENQI